MRREGEGRVPVMLPFFPKHSHTSARNITLHPPQISTIRLFSFFLSHLPGASLPRRELLFSPFP